MAVICARRFDSHLWDGLAYIVAGVRWEIPELSNAPYSLILLIPAVLYYITPIRGWINQASHARITENLRAGMVEIAEYDDEPQKYSWANLRSLFFTIVDEDKSLSTKASLAYFTASPSAGRFDYLVIEGAGILDSPPVATTFDSVD